MENYFFLSIGKYYFLGKALHILEETNMVYCLLQLINSKTKLALSLLKLKNK